MARTTQRGTTRDLTTTEAERRLLRFLARAPTYHGPDWAGPSFTVAELAFQLGLAPEACCQALYWLVRRDELYVEILDASRFQLLPRGDVCYLGRAGAADEARTGGWRLAR